MPTSTMSRLRTAVHIEPQPADAAPPLRRVAKAGGVALLGSVVSAIVLSSVGQAVFTYPVEFDKFAFPGYVVLTVLGVIGAVICWTIVTRLTSAPRWLYSRLAVLVTVVLLVPDFWLLTQAGNPVGPVVMLMVEHIAIAVITYFAMVRLAPAMGSKRLDEGLDHASPAT